MAGVRAISIEDSVHGHCMECPINYPPKDGGDARLRLMAHVKQTGHKTRVTIHSVFEFVPA
jgi:hypothetical protein